MDNLTHSLVGSLIGQAGLKRRTGLAMPALIIGANLPDLDAACFFWLDGVEHLGFRRGITHGPIAWVLLPLLLAGALWWFDRWQAGRGKRPADRLPVSFKWLYLLALLSCLTHPALDWLNVYGIRLLEPFSSTWYYGDVLFIIDIWLWLLMGFVTWFSLLREKRGGEWRRPARIAIGVALAYIGMNGWISKTASYDAGREASVGTATEHGIHVIASPVPLAFWERETIRSELASGDQGALGPIYHVGRWSVLGKASDESPMPRQPCAWLDDAASGEEADAFIFWSRAPFAERAPDGSVILRDARFYDPRARDRFSVALPDVECEPLASPSP
jgi:inner membrane protein